MLTLRDLPKGALGVVNDGIQLFDLESLASLKGTCSGPAFIVASGPSVRDFPIERYAHVPMFAVNGSILGFQRAGVQPFFYVCDDPNFPAASPQVVVEASRCSRNMAVSVSVIDSLLNSVPDFKPVCPAYHMERLNRPWRGRGTADRKFAWSIRNNPDYFSSFSLFSKKKNRVGFSADISKGYFCARTVPFVALQLAYHLGFSSVILVGVDLNSKLGRFYESEADCDALPSALDEDYDRLILPSFELVAQRVVKPGAFEVFNLFEGGRLPCTVFPRIKNVDCLDEFLGKII